jgi:hypothetical protein
MFLGHQRIDGSRCDHGLISLPYLDGPRLEHYAATESESSVRFLWLLPITETEREYVKAFGLEALEHKFDSAGLDYSNPARPSVI